MDVPRFLQGKQNLVIRCGLAVGVEDVDSQPSALLAHGAEFFIGGRCGGMERMAAFMRIAGGEGETVDTVNKMISHSSCA